MADNAALSSSKVHYTGIPCGCNRGRWSSTHLSSTSDMARVTCGNCLRIVAREADSLRRPVYRDGVPANLEAAASDALDWLEWWQRALEQSETLRNGMSDAADADLWRFNATIEALRSFLPTDEPVYNVAEEVSEDGD